MEKFIDFDQSFIRGSNSSMTPDQLPLGSCWQLMNMINISGVLSCRPGYKCIIELPGGNLQGAALFRPQVGLEEILVAVDGRIYVAPYPFTNFRRLENIIFSESSLKIFWAQATQSTQRNPDTSITVVEPREVMFMQDGGRSAPAFYDGSNSGHIRGTPFETPSGSVMVWVGDRLWVAVGNRLYASDIGNPFSFQETLYLGGSDFLIFSRDITAMVVTPSLQFPQLVVFTEENASIVEANIRDRNRWQLTDGFQREILQEGCVSNRAVVSHFGRVNWYSPSGFMYYDAASSTAVTSRTPIRDNEMIVDKARLQDDLQMAAMGLYDQWLLISLPAENLRNKRTFVLNNAAFETIQDTGGPTWCGHWLGTLPVEWVWGHIAGTERIYHVSADEDGVNRLWEAFRPERLDNGCPITWAMYSRGYFGLSSQARKLPGAICRFAWAEAALLAIEEDLDVGMFYAPGTRGKFVPIMSKKISVERGSLCFDREICATSELCAFKAQSRIARSEDANQNDSMLESGDCPVESEHNDNIDESFQLLIVGQGPATIRWVRSVAFEEPDPLEGDSKACEDEVPFNTLRFDGAGAYDEDINAAVAKLLAQPFVYFESNQTATVTQDGFSAVGVGFAESIISQRAADRVAKIIAIKQAENEIASVIPPILSLGEGF